MKRHDRRKARTETREPARHHEGGMFWWHMYGAIVIPDGGPESEALGASIIYGPTAIAPDGELPSGELVRAITPTSTEGVRGSYVTSFDHMPSEAEETAALAQWRAATEARSQEMNASLLDNLLHDQGQGEQS